MPSGLYGIIPRTEIIEYDVGGVLTGAYRKEYPVYEDGRL